jgi:hypothetical protein
VWDQVRDQVWDQVRDQVWGQHDAGWLSFYDTFKRLGIKEAARLDGLGQVAKSSGWWWPREGLVILTERPTRLERDDEGRLHSEAGAALLYPDGWGIWVSHGTRVPQQVIEAPKTLTVEQITGEQNVEVRRVMVERFGMDRYMKEAGGKLVDEDTDELGKPRKLWKLAQADDEDIVMVELVNSTVEPDGEFKHYMLRVSPECGTAWDAVAWTWGMRADDYLLSVQS